MSRMIVTAALALSLAAAPDPAAGAEKEKEKRASSGKQQARAISERPEVEADSPLVRAARKAQEAREKSGRAQISIDDDTVRNSAGKLTINHTPAPEIGDTGEPAGELLTRMAADKREDGLAAADRQRRLREIREEIEKLKAQLAGTEDDYYDEEDEAYREGVLYPRFETARKALAEKQKELSALESSASGSPQPAGAPSTSAAAPAQGGAVKP